MRGTVTSKLTPAAMSTGTTIRCLTIRVTPYFSEVRLRGPDTSKALSKPDPMTTARATSAVAENRRASEAAESVDSAVSIFPSANIEGIR